MRPILIDGTEDMVRRPERNFYQQIARNLPKVAGGPFHLLRVENVALVGTPDVNYCIRGHEGWAELKAWQRVRFSGRFTVPKFRPEQAAWLAKRASVGGRAYLLVKINNGIALFDGRLAPALFDKNLHLEWADAPRVANLWSDPIDWGSLATALSAPIIYDLDVQRRLSLFRSRYDQLAVSQL